MNWYVVKYVGKCNLVPKDIWTVTNKEQLYYEIDSIHSNYTKAKKRAVELNYSANLYKSSLKDSLSNGEPLRPLKNDIMEITDVNT